MEWRSRNGTLLLFSLVKHRSDQRTCNCFYCRSLSIRRRDITVKESSGNKLTLSNFLPEYERRGDAWCNG